MESQRRVFQYNKVVPVGQVGDMILNNTIKVVVRPVHHHSSLMTKRRWSAVEACVDDILQYCCDECHCYTRQYLCRVNSRE